MTAHRELCRRELLLGGAAVVLGACAAKVGPSPLAGSIAAASTPSRGVELHSWFDLPRDDPRSRELSGLAWDAKRGVLWAVQDEAASIVSLVPSADLRSWRFGETITVDVDGPVDLEGLVVLDDGFILSSEDGPRVIEVDRRGRFRREIPLPPRLRDARQNRSLESLTASPDGRWLFTTTEAALTVDGEKASAERGTRVRIHRMERNHEGAVGTTEHVYETDPAPYANGDWGVADMAALSDDELLVLERGWAKGHGNTARIYHTSLADHASCSLFEPIAGSASALRKTLRCDVGNLHCPGLPPAKQLQASPLLDNYEGIAIGPRLAAGRASVIIVSDDNGHDNQFARICVLRV